MICVDFGKFVLGEVVEFGAGPCVGRKRSDGPNALALEMLLATELLHRIETNAILSALGRLASA